MRRPPLTLPGAATLLLCLAAPLQGQVRGSERALIQQTVDGTTISVDYGRPHIRGRGAVFGEGRLVNWGHPWTPGANWATIVAVSKDVTINGTPVPQGRYSVWMTPGPREFEVMLDPNDSIFHTMRPEPREGQIRFAAPAVEGDPVEALTFSFPVVRSDGTDLLLQWGSRTVTMTIEVQPTQKTTIAEAVAAPYVGTYEVEWVLPVSPADVSPPAEQMKVHSTLKLSHANDHLTGLWDMMEFQPVTEVMMVPITPGIFHPGWMLDGQLFETETDLWMEFQLEGGKVVGFELRDAIEDAVFVKGKKVG